MSGQRHASALFIPGIEPVPIVPEAGWDPGTVWMGAEKLSPPGFDPQTVQPSASRYTDWAIPVHSTRTFGHKYVWNNGLFYATVGVH